MDPPDEVIPKHTPANMIQVTSPNAQTSTKTQSVSRLTLAVTAFTASRLWRLRTLLTVVCAVTVVSLETTQGVVFPGIMILLPMDCALLVYAALTHCSSQSDPNRANPLGKLSLLKVPLMVVYPVSAQWFDSVCLSALLVGHLLCDTLFMMFCIILSQCILNFV